MLNPKTIQQDKYREVRDHQRPRDTKLGDQPGPLVITAMNISDFPMIFPTLWYKTKKVCELVDFAILKSSGLQRFLWTIYTIACLMAKSPVF